jgi:hypothetical protein
MRRIGMSLAISAALAKTYPREPEPYPQKALFDYLSTKAPQIGNLS